MLAVWLDEERQQSPGVGLNRQLWAVNLRVQNELALWLLDSAGTEHDRRQQQALARPRSCEMAGKSRTLMDWAALRAGMPTPSGRWPRPAWR